MTYHRKSDDTDLIQGCRDQHRLAQQYLYQRYYGRLIGIPMRYCSQRDEAIEVLNLAFVKIFDAIGHYQQTGSLGGWMGKIVLHTSIDFVRSKLAYRKHFSDVTVIEQATDNDAVQQLMAEDLFKLIQLLPDTERTVFNLFVVDGFRHREIGAMLGFDEGTSRWYLSKARQQLQGFASYTLSTRLLFCIGMTPFPPYHHPSGDQHIREQLQQHEFPFEPQGWEQMEQLLDKNRDIPKSGPVTDTAAVPQASIRTTVLCLSILLILVLFNQAVHYQQPKPAVLTQAATDGIAQSPSTLNNSATTTNTSTSAAPGNSTLLPSSTAETGEKAIAQNKFLNLKKNKTTQRTTAETANQKQQPAATIPAQITTKTTDNQTDATQQLSTQKTTAIQTLPYPSPRLTAKNKPHKPKPMPGKNDDKWETLQESPLHIGWLAGGSLTATAYYPMRYSLRPVAGIVMRKNMSPGIDIQAELTARWAKDYHFYLKEIGSEYNATFNQVIKWEQTWTAEHMAFVEMPVLMRIQAHRDYHRWLIGLRGSYNIPFKKKYTSYCQCGDAPEPDPKVDFDAAFRKWNMGLVLGTEFRLKEQVYLDLRYGQGLIDLTKDAYFRDKKFHLNSDIQLSIRRFWQ